MPKLIICRGLPASGKTTWARAVVGRHLGDMDKLHAPDDAKWVRVNRDDIRNMAHDGAFIPGVTEDVVIAIRDSAILSALRKGWNVISDDTNLRSKNVRDLMKLAEKAGAGVEFEDLTDVSLDECIIRDNWRMRNDERSVGEDVIRDTYDRYLRGKQLPLPVPEVEEAVIFSPLPHGDHPAAIIDLDGTLAHNDGHRGWYEYDKVGKDTPKSDVVDVARSLFFAYGNIIILSGRSDSCRDITEQWLRDHVFWDTWAIESLGPGGGPIHSSGIYLLMRSDGDHRDDAVVKYELYRDCVAPHFNVKVVLDDRNRVVNMWRQIGLTCLQVQDGDF